MPVDIVVGGGSFALNGPKFLIANPTEKFFSFLLYPFRKLNLVRNPKSKETFTVV